MKATIYKFIGKFREKIDFNESFFSVILFGPRSKLFRFLSETIQSGYQYYILRANGRICKRKKQTLNEKLSTLWRKIPAEFVKTSIHMFMRTVWTGEFLETISIFKHNRTLSDKNLAFVKIDLTELWRLPSTCPLEKLGDKDLGWIFFQKLNKKSSV